mgnify:CR=1 FL=1
MRSEVDALYLYWGGGVKMIGPMAPAPVAPSTAAKVTKWLGHAAADCRLGCLSPVSVAESRKKACVE